MKGTLAELRLHQVAGGESFLGIVIRFGPGHVISRSGETAYVARCGMVVVEIRNQTICTQEIPVMFRGEQMYCRTTHPGPSAHRHPGELPDRDPSSMENRKVRPCDRPDPLQEHRPGELRTVTGSREVLQEQGDIGNRLGPVSEGSPKGL
jgi:hypothetical protein